MPSTSKELTREELYELVWERPMSRLAEEFGISGNGLAKICRRMDVPYPPRGWWAKKEHGKAIKVDPLPPTKPETIAKITVTPTPADDSGLKLAIRQKGDELGEIVVPLRLVHPHSLILGWREKRQLRIEEAKRERDPWRRSLYAVPDFTSSDRRRHRILHALFQSLEQAGGKIGETDRGHLVATICDEAIEFSLQEKSRQVTRPLTADEKRWESWNNSGVKTELELTGHFQFSIKVWVDQPIRKNWMEGDNRPLDRMLPEIVATFLMLGPFLAERTRVRREEARQFAERQHQFELERQHTQRDENRWQRFLKIAQGWQQVELARAFISRLKELDHSHVEAIDGLTPDEWLSWAEEHARRCDPVAQGVQNIFSDIAQVTAWTNQRYR